MRQLWSKVDDSAVECMEALGGNICINTDQSEVSVGVELTAVV